MVLCSKLSKNRVAHICVSDESVRITVPSEGYGTVYGSFIQPRRAADASYLEKESGSAIRQGVRVHRYTENI